MWCSSRKACSDRRPSRVLVISMFHGILNRMYTLDTQYRRVPHFHARFGEFEASIAIEDGETLAGDLSRKASRLVQAWAELHRDELMADQMLAVAGQQPFRIDPL